MPKSLTFDFAMVLTDHEMLSCEEVQAQLNMLRNQKALDDDYIDRLEKMCIDLENKVQELRSKLEGRYIDLTVDASANKK